MPPASPERQPRHHRSIDVQVYARADGLWELDAQLTDTKSRDVTLANGVRKAGEPIHDMVLRLVFDRDTTIVAAGSESRSVPYPGHCDDHGDAYAALVGMNLLRGFRRDVQQRLGGTRACTHLTELTQVLPTAVVQAFAGDVIQTDPNAPQRPFQLDGCHALRVAGPVVHEHYPRWFRSPASTIPG